MLLLLDLSIVEKQLIRHDSNRVCKFDVFEKMSGSTRCRNSREDEMKSGTPTLERGKEIIVKRKKRKTEKNGEQGRCRGEGREIEMEQNMRSERE